MELSYYPGCSLHGTAHDYDSSIISVFTHLGVSLVELEDWNCCGASSAHVMNPSAAIDLPARNLRIAAISQRLLLTPCAACFHRLKLCQTYLQEHCKEDPQTSQLARIKVIHINEMLLHEEVLARIKLHVQHPLEGLRAVPYYGCLTVRPPKAMKHPDPENPTEMDTILKILGADVVNWSYKTDCCGGNLAMTRPDVVRNLSGNLFDAALEAGGEIIVTDCPMCQANLDTRQKQIERERNTKYQLPVLYVTELLGLAMNLTETRSWWPKHLVDPVPVFGSKGWQA